MARTKLFVLCIVLIGLTGAPAVLWGQTPRFAYVANLGGNVSAYTLNGITGTLAPVRVCDGKLDNRWGLGRELSPRWHGGRGKGLEYEWCRRGRNR
jgi:hypothetical protein